MDKKESVALSKDEITRFEESLKKWNEMLRPIGDEVHESERLTADDFAIRIK